MHLVYVDDSKDEKTCCFSAIIIPAEQWSKALEHLIHLRRTMKAVDGIYTTIELHATDWLGGRGNVAPVKVLRSRRAAIFRIALRHFAKLPECSILNAHGRRSQDSILFERLCNRLQTNMAKQRSRAIIISDEGKSYDSLVRRMRRYNPIPSRFGGVVHRPLDRIVEDLVYRKSERSLFIQAADFCAYSLLRMETPTPSIITRGLQDAFLELKPALELRAYAKDPRKLGIIRAD
jgi:Protein of unknown function (DUF3800)